MTKLVAAAFTAAAIFLGTNVNAQSTPKSAFRFGLGLEVGAPTGNAHDFSKFELGGTARLQYGVADNLALTLTSGYYNMFGREIGNTGANYNDLGIVPLKAGVKAFFSQNLYFGAEVGAGFETNGASNTKLIVAPGLGWANRTWDIGARYENFSGQGYNYGLAGLRIAYGFAL
ncbi:hypothetical protein FFF34_003655 [Inquilinus sp. KBS0705]|nr:hypothetical protein FFF34_003655 [Inquilinus sp. KBS0705]